MKIKNYLLYVLAGISLVMNAHSDTKDPNAYALMTAHDLEGMHLSNISLINKSGTALTASGLFIASFDVNDCSQCFGNIASGDNLGGAVMSPVYFKPNETLPIGQNFLYNMLYNGMYYIKNLLDHSPCSLPGCSWPEDDDNITGWCITINAPSLDSTYTYSYYTNGSNLPANAPAYGYAGNSLVFNYKYDLINPFNLGNGNACLGPIICDDKTLRCHVETPQTEEFAPYV